MGRQTDLLFNSETTPPAAPQRLSRSKVDLFVECPRCFFLDVRLGVKRPPSFPFTLNQAVDSLLKRDFDVYRARAQPHPLFVQHGLDAKPFAHENLNAWRTSRTKGLNYTHPTLNITCFGLVDDIWIDARGKLIIADYKATARKEPITVKSPVYASYRRQLAFYAWLLQQQGFEVSHTGYLVYCNGNGYAERFDDMIKFATVLVPVALHTQWIEPTLAAITECLTKNEIPARSQECTYCAYWEAVATASASGTNL